MNQKNQSVNDAEKFSRLKRPRCPMPDFVREALLARGLMATYYGLLSEAVNQP
jgi:hypothetical protein